MKSFATNFPKNSPKLIFSLKKCYVKPLLADNDPFPFCVSWSNAVDVDILIKKIAKFLID